MDPLIGTVSSISPVIKAAAQTIETICQDARNLASDDAAYYLKYIDIAIEAIKGLENEYIGILVEASNCSINEEDQRRKLITRIDQFMYGEVLRPKLRDAIDRLNSGRQAFETHAAQWFTWPKTREERREALDNLVRLTDELRGYLGFLGDYAEISGGHISSSSAVGLKDIEKLKGILERKDGDFLRMIANDLLTDRDKTEFFRIIRDAARVTQMLRIAFR